jgi:hypothetical protein
LEPSTRRSPPGGRALEALSGAKAAGVGLRALGGAIVANASVAGQIVGTADHARKTGNDPKFARLLDWANSGAASNRCFVIEGLHPLDPAREARCCQG